MNQSLANFAANPFEAIRHTDELGEYWLARELMLTLGYSGKGNWQNFERIIREAQEACKSQGYNVDEVFSYLTKNPPKAGGRPKVDYRLTRFACYMIALSAEGSIEEVAAAKVYFAVKTRQREEDEDAFLLDDPEEWLERAIRSYMARGYSEAYARNRIDSILARNRLTGQWVLRGITEEEIPILTDRIHMGTFDISVDQHKGIKDFPLVQEGAIIRHKGNLRPALTPREMAVLTFAENITAAIHEERDSHGFQEIARDVDEGAGLAKEKRLEIEAATGTPVVSSRNMLKAPDGGLWVPLIEGDAEQA